VKRFVAQALVIARRDFSAIVLTPTFLIFLLAPLFMLSVATIGSLGAVHVVEGSRARTAVVAAPDKLPRLREAEGRLRRVAGTDPAPPPVLFETAQDDSVRQAHRLLSRDDISAVLIGGRVLHGEKAARDADYLALLAAAASGEEPELRTVAAARPGAGTHARNAAAFGAVFAMFFLSLLLASQAISMLAEERNNKVIEILAAAVPLEAVFLGKLIGMLGVALLFTLFWGSIAAAATFGRLGGLSFDAVAPASSPIGVALLFLGYFMLCFLLLGAVFLGVGAQAGTMREIQMLSLPVTIFQVSMFALASAGAGAPDSMLGMAAAVFPFSSPFAMAGRAATGVPAWQHVAAFAWQLAWLGITVTIAARLFRRGVLKSGGGKRG
jgi:ABC-2 type transport system permease protein